MLNGRVVHPHTTSQRETRHAHRDEVIDHSRSRGRNSRSRSRSREPVDVPVRQSQVAPGGHLSHESRDEVFARLRHEAALERQLAAAFDQRQSRLNAPAAAAASELRAGVGRPVQRRLDLNRFATQAGAQPGGHALVRQLASTELRASLERMIANSGVIRPPAPAQG